MPINNNYISRQNKEDEDLLEQAVNNNLYQRVKTLTQLEEDQKIELIKKVNTLHSFEYIFPLHGLLRTNEMMPGHKKMYNSTINYYMFKR